MIFKISHLPPLTNLPASIGPGDTRRWVSPHLDLDHTGLSFLKQNRVLFDVYDWWESGGTDFLTFLLGGKVVIVATAAGVIERNTPPAVRMVRPSRQGSVPSSVLRECTRSRIWEEGAGLQTLDCLRLMLASELALLLRREPVVVAPAPAVLELLARAGLFVKEPPRMVLKTAAFGLRLPTQRLLRPWLARLLARGLRWEPVGVSQAAAVRELFARSRGGVVVPLLVVALTWTTH